MDFKEKEMNLELKEQDSEHNKKKKEEGSPKRKKGCFKRVLSVLVLVVIIGFSFLAGRQSVMTSNAYGTGLNNGKILRKLSMLEAFAGNYYLNKIDAENVENNIYKGFAKGLQDPYVKSQQRLKSLVLGQGHISPKADECMLRFFQQCLAELFCFVFGKVKAKIESFKNMTVSVLLVILYHATFYFARGARKKHTHFNRKIGSV